MIRDRCTSCNQEFITLGFENACQACRTCSRCHRSCRSALDTCNTCGKPVCSACMYRGRLRGLSSSNNCTCHGCRDWEANTDRCSRCRTEFRWRTRRHHCRLCGLCICAGCSAFTFGKVLVCRRHMCGDCSGLSDRYFARPAGRLRGLHGRNTVTGKYEKFSGQITLTTSGLVWPTGACASSFGRDSGQRAVSNRSDHR